MRYTPFQSIKYFQTADSIRVVEPFCRRLPPFSPTMLPKALFTLITVLIQKVTLG
jgi:hypothetical protein